jgi:hypothetical protein
MMSAGATTLKETMARSGVAAIFGVLACCINALPHLPRTRRGDPFVIVGEMELES